MDLTEARSDAVDEMASGIEVALSEVRRQKRVAQDAGDTALAGICTATETKLLEAQEAMRVWLAAKADEAQPTPTAYRATAGRWAEVWSELNWQDEEGNAEALPLLNMLVDRTPAGVEEYEDSEEHEYCVWLLPAEKGAIERVTGIAF